ncbi:S8 family serine peptidase [Leptolyngbya sp. 7M]|uniref:S8 family serine peptidase n=1 Tax=Leptolyngbya sp. 7M TaxID=2812896 RepID=UPI001B8DA2D5|nr:S8 family serine peptidase [Leptolyngbya sp. 7M]QYO65844.1 S8 family serine peptidase [Leptolyngbya sp. 7M]
MRKIWIFASLVLVTTYCLLSAPIHTEGKSSKLIKTENAIPGRYIVVLDDKARNSLITSFGVEAEVYGLVGFYGGTVDKIYSHSLKGFAVEMSPEAASALSSDPRVLFVEEDAEIWPSVTAQSSPDWGLDRIDQANLPLNSAYVYGSNGAGVNVYVIDSGINPYHADFGGRATAVFDALNDGQNGIDCRGHGTHVAGIIGSSTYGVAKGANIYGLRVLPCSGSGQVSDLLAAVEWVNQNRIQPAVVNISMNLSGVSVAMTNSITNSINTGITYAVSAGNFNANACDYSPANISAALVAGATTSTDNRAGYSNFGPCIDVWAPGNGITSLDYLTNNGTRVMSGTSMASPMVAGVAALYLQNNPSASPATVQNVIKNSSTPNVVTNIDGTSSTNRMLYTWLGSQQPPTPGKVRIVKQVRTRNGGTASTQQFTYSATNLGPSSFNLVDNDAPPADLFENSAVYIFESPGSITVTEAIVNGWATNSITCVEVPAPGMTNVQNTTVDMINKRAYIVVEQGETVTCTFESDELTPTSAPISVSGRVTDESGAGVRNQALVLTNAMTGEQFIAYTNTFGYYSFGSVPSATFYVLEAAETKRLIFSPSSRSFTAEDDIAGMNFTAMQRF